MKHIILSIIFLFMATFLYSQEEFKKGTIVKGKDVVDTFLGATGRTVIPVIFIIIDNLTCNKKR